MHSNAATYAETHVNEEGHRPHLLPSSPSVLVAKNVRQDERVKRKQEGRLSSGEWASLDCTCKGAKMNLCLSYAAAPA